MVAHEIIESLKPRLPSGVELTDTTDSWRGPNPIKTFLELTEIRVVWRKNLAYIGREREDDERAGKEM